MARPPRRRPFLACNAGVVIQGSAQWAAPARPNEKIMVTIVGNHIQGEVLARGGSRRLDPAAFMRAVRAVEEGCRLAAPEKRYGRYAFFPKARKAGETYRDSRGQLFLLTEKGARRVSESQVSAPRSQV